MNFDETLRDADPASSLSPLSPDRFERLRVAAMTETPTTPARRPRARLTFAIAGGVAALALGGFAVASLTASTPPTQLTAPADGIAAKCLEVTPASFETTDVAFKATATSIEGDTVLLTVTNLYTGEVADTVETTQGDGAISDGGPLVYEEGESYLIAATDGRILSCGISSLASDYLEGIYEQTFAK